jgi:hypothetical protein
MATARQLELDQAVRSTLKQLGENTTTEFLIAAASERTSADPREIVEAVKAVNCREDDPSRNQQTPWGRRSGAQELRDSRHPIAPGVTGLDQGQEPAQPGDRAREG